jgi:hypothetical protein
MIFYFLKELIRDSVSENLYLKTIAVIDFSNCFDDQEVASFSSHFQRPCFGTAKVPTFSASAIFILNSFQLKIDAALPFLWAAKVITFCFYPKHPPIIFKVYL